MLHPRILTVIGLSALLLGIFCFSALSSAAADSADPIGLDAVSAVLGTTSVFPITTSEAINHLPAIAYNTKRDEFLVVWHTEYAFGGTRDVWGRFVRSDGELLGDAFTIASESNMHNFQPAVAYDEKWNRYLVTWVRSPNENGSGGDIWGRFIPFTGPAYTYTMFPICEWSSSQWGPKIAYTVYPDYFAEVPSFMVVWWNEPGESVPNYVSGRKIDEYGVMGSIFPVSPIETTEGRQMPDIAANPAPWSPNRYLVVYEMMHDNGPNSEVRGRFLNVNGVTQGDEFAISDSGDYYGLQSHPAVASCGSEFAVIYQRSVNQYDIYVQFIDAWSPSKLGGILPLAITSALEHHPDIACGGDLDRYLATWSQQFSGISGIGISSALVFSDGKFGPYQLLMRPANGPLNRDYSAIASDFNLFTAGNYGFMVAAEAEHAGGMIGIQGVTVLTKGIFLPIIKK